MDDIEFMVQETFKHLQESAPVPTPVPVVENKIEEGLPREAGILYHLQKSSSIFVIRTMVSQNIRDDYYKICERPEDYPSLRLVEEGSISINCRLRFFTVDSGDQAEIIHDQLNNRRFPIFEETMCNLSDPGFSWWLTKKDNSFQVAFNLSVSLKEETVKLGPLGDHHLAVTNFQNLSRLISDSGLHLDLQSEANRVQFADADPLISEELQDLFEFGVVGEGMTDIFKLLARRNKDHSAIETAWFYLQELAAIRRFWIQIQYDLNNM